MVYNINGFFYINDDIADQSEAIKICCLSTATLIIKPTIGSGQGKMVNAFKIQGSNTSYNNLSVEELFKCYNKDFVVQEFLQQSEILNLLNPTSLNTLRVVSYLNNDGVHILASVLRIGQLGNYTDNFSTRGLFCNVLDNGQLEGKGYNAKSETITKTSTGRILKDCIIPNFKSVKVMTKSKHYLVPYFKIIFWDIAIDKNNEPVLIEYNTNKQGIDLQITSGPLFGVFTEEILEIGKS